MIYISCALSLKAKLRFDVDDTEKNLTLQNNTIHELNKTLKSLYEELKIWEKVGIYAPPKNDKTVVGLVFIWLLY